MKEVPCPNCAGVFLVEDEKYFKPCTRKWYEKLWEWFIYGIPYKRAGFNCGADYHKTFEEAVRCGNHEENK